MKLGAFYSICNFTLICVGIFWSLGSGASAQDWPRFLGDSGAATSTSAELPTTWSADENLKWETKLPGPGASSPVVFGDRIYLTAYTGYGTKEGEKINDLKRHLICIDRSNGNILWDRTIDNSKVKDEDPYKSYITQHGYATNTPVTDGKTIFAFFGKAGVFAFDTNGEQLWHASIENTTNKTRWGSAASPILFKGNLIVNAVEECGKIFSLSQADGSVQWEYDTKSTLAYSTPNLVKTADGKVELVVAVPEKLIGLNPVDGSEKWYTKTTLLNEVNAAVLVKDDIVFVYGGFRGVGSLAVRTGGEGDVSKSHVVWESSDTSYIATPVINGDYIYWLNKSGIAHCVEADTGKQVYRERVPGIAGGRGIKFFGSVVCDGKNIFAVSRNSGTFVLAAKPEYELLSQNIIKGDDSEFNGSPAISNGQLFLRSNQFLYCLQKN